MTWMRKACRMLAQCDGCNISFRHSINKINAKEVFPNYCNVPVEDARNCENEWCVYCPEGAGCGDFQFCDKCIKDTTLVKRFIKMFAKENG